MELTAYSVRSFVAPASGSSSPGALSVKEITMSDSIRIFEASKHYSALLDSFSCDEKLKVNLDSTGISEAIYFHICKMKYAGWRHRINFKRNRKHSISEFFQDIIAFYLKAALPNDYTIELEPKKNKTQPDIAIKRSNKYVFLIEIKTNIGWDRPDTTAIDPYKKIEDRITELSTSFDVPKENIIYVFEEHGNVSKEFSDRFWDKEQQKSKPRPKEFPFSIIFPLFNKTDPYYWKHSKGFNRTMEYRKLSDNEILFQAQHNIVTPIEEVLRRITTATVSEEKNMTIQIT